MPGTVRIERLDHGFADGWTAHYRRRLGWLRPFEAALRRPSGSIADAVAWRVARRHEHRPWEVAWMEPAITAGASAIARHKPKVILATAPPYESLKAGWTLHKRTGLPLVVDFRDPWTWGLPWNPSSEKRAREERAWEARVMADASLVLVVTPSMQRTMAEMYPEQAGKIRLLMNGYEDAGDAAAAPPADRFVLSYAGSILERRLPPALFEGLRRLRAKHPETAAEVRVQLIGANHTNRPLPDRLREEDVADMVEWVGAVSPDQCRTLLRSSHVLLHMEGTAQYAISGKLFEYLSSNRQVLWPRAGGQRRRVVPDEIGWRRERRTRRSGPRFRRHPRAVGRLPREPRRAAGRPREARPVPPSRADAHAGLTPRRSHRRRGPSRSTNLRRQACGNIRRRHARSSAVWAS